MPDDVPWLDEREQRVWRTWLRLNAEMRAALQREMQADSGLSMSDFEVLVHLGDAPCGQIRVSDLAEALSWDRSRLSHHLRRMQARGLIDRRECAEDGRVSYVAVTAAGRAALEEAAPGHVRTVRRLFFDALEPGELDGLARTLEGMEAATLRRAD